MWGHLLPFRAAWLLFAYPNPLLEIIVFFVLPEDKKVSVWLLCSSNNPFFFWYIPSSFDPRVLSLTRNVESCPNSKSSPVNLNSGVSEMDFGLFVRILLIIFGCWPVYRSYRELFLADGFILSANRIFLIVNSPCGLFLLARNLSFIGESAFLFSHSPCDHYSGILNVLWHFFSQNSLGRLLLTIVARQYVYLVGSVSRYILFIVRISVSIFRLPL